MVLQLCSFQGSLPCLGPRAAGRPEAALGPGSSRGYPRGGRPAPAVKGRRKPTRGLPEAPFTRPAPELRSSKRAGTLLASSTLGPQENTVAPLQTGKHLRSLRNSEAPQSPYTRDPAGKTGAAGRSRNPFSSSQAGGGPLARPLRSPSEPPGRLKRLAGPAELGARRTGVFQDGGPGSAAVSCRGRRRTGAEGQAEPRPRPGPSRCSGRLARLDRAGDCRSFGGWRGGHKSGGPQTALALPGQSSTWACSLSRHLRRPPPPLYCSSPHPRSQPAAPAPQESLSPPDPRVPAWVSGPVILGSEILHVPRPHPWHALSRVVLLRPRRCELPLPWADFSALESYAGVWMPGPAKSMPLAVKDTAWVWG